MKRFMQIFLIVAFTPLWLPVVLFLRTTQYKEAITKKAFYAVAFFEKKIIKTYNRQTEETCHYFQGGNMNVKGNHQLGEILAAKLFSIETVPAAEQKRMVSRAIKTAIEWCENNQKLKLDGLPCKNVIGCEYIKQ